MKTVKHILLPTDFSTTSQNAFRYALHVADAWNLAIDVVHIVQPEVEPMDFPIVASEAMKAKNDVAQIAMQEFIQLAEAEEHAKDIEISTTIEMGLPGDLVPEMAEQIGSGTLIIMGTRREHDSFERFLGSVSTSIAQNAPSPVWIIPAEAQMGEIKNVMFATEMREADTLKIMELVGMMKTFKPTLHCVHISEKNKKTEVEAERLASLFEENAREINVQFHTIENTGNMVENLDRAADKYNADLLVMVRSQRSFLKRLFSPSLTRKMVFHTHIPILVLR